MKRLVVVESPTKARTIRNYLPAGYRVEASMGHVRDLPASADEVPEELKAAAWARLGVNVEAGFAPLYVVPADKRKVVRQLKDALKEADELFIATDEDREGESIGWHLVQVLHPKVPVRRMVFHEITKEAILGALEKTRTLNEHLIDAQETRRILDRLVGYTISPLLWKKLAPRLSAGRVQSVAVRLLVLREQERIHFVPATYWGLRALLDKDGSRFEAVMTHLGDLRLATGRDFEDETGRLKPELVSGKNILLLNEAQARELAARLPETPWRVTRVEARLATRAPAPPFITSTLQQEASRKLGLSAQQTMRLAQQLYEQGYITYMRTDSTNLSQEALDACRRVVQARYGEAYLSPTPRQYSSRVRNAQEAHEAIRPAGQDMKTVEEQGLKGVEGALYDLIWKRTVASQMADARLRLVTAQIEAGAAEPLATFRASGRTIEFPGFFRAYVEGSDDPEAALDDREQPLPPLQQGDRPACRRLEAQGHETKPPARYTDAILIKTLESEGIGRPSTYASIIDTIIQRGYVFRQGNHLIPTFTAFAANTLMEAQFQQLVDAGFTARMEQVLDDIAAGQTPAGPFLQEFYLGPHGIQPLVTQGLDRIDARRVSSIHFPKWGDYVVRIGRFGPYIEHDHDGTRVITALPDNVVPAEVTRETLEALIRAGQQQEQPLGHHPRSGQPIYLRKGPYGHYVQLGDDEKGTKPLRVSLTKKMDPAQVTLEQAVALLTLPRTLGKHPETGKPILAGIGRFGPYVQHGETFASLQPSDEVMGIDLATALNRLQAKENRTRPMRIVGNHPQTGIPIELWQGRYGPYVKHQETNASLPKGMEPDALTLVQAVELLVAREGSEKPSAGRKKPPATKKTDATPTRRRTAAKGKG
jgi:DNA topoisomerase-1